MSKPSLDPVRKREFLLSRCGIELALDGGFNEAKAEKVLGACAHSNLGTAIECLLVGLDEPAERLLHRSVEWSQAAIAAEERPDRYFPDGTEAGNLYTLTLSNWLLFDQHNADAYERFVYHEDRYLANSKYARDRASVALKLPKYVDAGKFARAIEIFEHTPRLSPPKSLVLRGEAAMSYVLSRYQLGLQYSRDDIDRSTARFLKSNVDPWFGDGQSLSVAMWMKIVHWNMASPRPSAREALLKCYDYVKASRPTNWPPASSDDENSAGQ